MPKLVYHDSDGVDRTLNLGAETLTIGRGSDCQIQTQDAMVSRRHARITWDGNYWIEDLGSSNGVYIGNEKVQKAPFRPGDIVTCGSLILRMMPDTSPRALPDAMTQPPPALRHPIPIAVEPPPPAPAQAPPTPVQAPEESSRALLDRERKRSQALELQIAELERQLAETTSSDTSVRPTVPPVDSQVADTIILLSDAVASVRSNLRAANGEATLLKEPDESAQMVRESLRSAAEALERVRLHLRSLAKLLGV